MTLQDCYLCGQIKGQPDRDLIAQMLPGSKYVRRVMLESDAFAVIPSLGPLTDGHALLCPKLHVRSFATLSPDLYAEYDAMKRRLRQDLNELYSSTMLLFEHGMAAAGHRIPCSVDHAHLHFVPLHALAEAALVPSLPWRKFDGSIAALSSLVGGDEYLQVETSDGVCRIATKGTKGFESQFMRKMIAARARSKVGWNWRDLPNPDAAHATWQRFTLR
ncbi:MAG: HIT domain-containing protein [Nitrospira defluvii]|nr:HIT domain-containing protein [Nitrospira defluvii]